MVGGGTSQIKTVIKPSGESILLNGFLSGDYVENKEYDSSTTDLNHLFPFMMEKKDESVDEKDVATAPYYYHIPPGSNDKSTFSDHKVIGTFSEEIFKKNTYTEILIPVGMYGWVLEKWDDSNQQLLPLRFSNLIFVIEKNYKKNFLQYIGKYRRNYLIGTISLIMLSLIILAPIIFLIVNSIPVI